MKTDEYRYNRVEKILVKRIIVKIPPENIMDAHNIVEACDFLAVVRTLEPDIAIVELLATPDTFEDSLKISQMMEKLLGAEILHPVGHLPEEKADKSTSGRNIF